jgi:hypothetical protein
MDFSPEESDDALPTNSDDDDELLVAGFSTISSLPFSLNFI